MLILYNLIIYSYSFLIRIAGLFDKKANTWIKGRKGIFSNIADQIDPLDKLAWFHAASLGEFEQGRPIIESFREKFPEYKILLTFFSPSGFEIRKNYEGADFVFYLPIDTKANARKFIKLVNPTFVVFIKYEFWYNYLTILRKNNIPVFFASSIFRKQQHFFQWYGSWFKKMLRTVSFFFVQNQESVTLLNSIGIAQVLKSGDTRFDRVFKIAQNTKSFPLIEKFSENENVLLAGSTWPADEEALHHLIHQIEGLKMIIAPHEIKEERIKSLMSLFNDNKIVRFSEADINNIDQAKILIIDGMGFLSQLYQYCTLAYIGGGFGNGIHNTLEAATFGKPVVFGPNYLKFAEAIDLIKLNGAFSINKKENLGQVVSQLLKNDKALLSASQTCQNYVKGEKGATDIILNKISKIIQL